MLGEDARRLAYGGTHAGVVARFDGQDATPRCGIVALAEILEQVEADVLAAQRGKAVDAEAVAGGGQRLGEKQKRVADHVDDAMAIRNGGIGRHRQVSEQQAGQVAFAAGLGEIAAGFRRMPGGAVGEVAHAGIDVEFRAVGLPLQPASLRRAGSKLAAQLLRGGRQLLRQGRGFGVAGDHRLEQAVLFQHQRLAIVPFR
ncbi:hypothetical protein SDC9_173790 [bioreactor metagenome]|uniref:Uncharacterized protein n=1 Tax=bioreactor metagenome TaxID=1076179 RepID=A0A645GJF2_9ZZZZ